MHSTVDEGNDWNTFQRKVSKLAAVEMKAGSKLEKLVSAHISAQEAADNESESSHSSACIL